MLLIRNIEAIINTVILGKWWVKNYELVGDTQYQFSLMHTETLKQFTIQVERMPIGAEKLIYEVWAWKEDGNIIRKMVDLKHFRQVNSFSKILNSFITNYLKD